MFLFCLQTLSMCSCIIRTVCVFHFLFSILHIPVYTFAMTEKIYTIGHKSPDTDTVVSAIVAAEFLNLREGTDAYEPRITGALNTETQFVLSNFGIETPAMLTEAKGEMLVLVDHNEAAQVVDGEKTIVGIIDHHKVNFSGSEPIEVVVKPWGSTATVLMTMFAEAQLEVPSHCLGLLLSAILSDTVILRSPTTTDHDRVMVQVLAESLQIDYEQFGIELFKAKAQVASKTPMEIIKNDYKEFTIGSKNLAIGQIEMPDLTELDQKIPAIIEEMRSLKQQGNLHSVLLVLTDIVKEGSKILIISDEEQKIAGAFSTTVENTMSQFVPGLMSRKKQVVPVLTELLA